MAEPNPFVLSAEDLLAYFEQRHPRAIENWGELGAEEYGRAFAVARTAGYDVIADLYRAMIDVLAAKGTEVDYAAQVIPILRQKGWLPQMTGRQLASRVELIWFQNLRNARAAGAWDRTQRLAQTFPYLRGFTARDNRVRGPRPSDHHAWEGIVLPVSHPFWARWWPPLGFRCRCQVQQLTRSQLLLRGGVTPEEELARREAALGVPIFASPGAGLYAQIGKLVDGSNEHRVEGMPPINGQTELGRGAGAWKAVRGGMGEAAANRLIEQLFGKAA